MESEIIKIIEGGLERNNEKVKKYAKIMAEKLNETGDENLSKKINKLLEKTSVHPVYLDSFLIKPIDSESKLDMVDVSVENIDIEIVLPEITKQKTDEYINLLKNKDKLLKFGLDIPSSLILYGPPGSGKTTLAHYIAEKTKLPLITAKLDGLISSYLGNTAKNIRKIFEYASERPCILFLDEFDAIAKSRDDSQEIGELKRIVNSLLQNIDEFNKENILIVATNHEKLLDIAIWRRFSTKIEVPYPKKEEIKKLLSLFFGKIKNIFGVTEKQLDKLSDIFIGQSPAEIKNIIYSSVKNLILSNNNNLKYIDILNQIYLIFESAKNDNKILFFHKNGIVQNEISSFLNIPRSKISKEIKKEEGKNGK